VHATHRRLCEHQGLRYPTEEYLNDDFSWDEISLVGRGQAGFFFLVGGGFVFGGAGNLQRTGSGGGNIH